MKEPQEQIPIDISFPTKEFEKHLSLEGNQRIIFSGPFGAGKTYFLREFFSNEEKYACIRLAPINYSVAQNEDVFELIKFDILFELLRKGAVPKKARVSKDVILKHLSLLEPVKGIKGLLEKAGKTGRNILPELGTILKGTADSQDGVDSAQDVKELKDFMTKIARERGGIYEHNVLTQLLYFLVGNLDKESVLVIDDLDRMDPEHIFRILNVFAANFDIDENGNKFGFDRVVLVCDIDNVRRIFANRYGQNVDFSGYIDKFYSREVFQFENIEAVNEIISKVICSMSLDDTSIRNPAIGFRFNDPQSSANGFIHYILRAFLIVNAVNLRSFWRWHKKKIDFEPKRFRFLQSTYSTHQYELIWILEFIRKIVGDGETLLHGIQKCVNAKIGESLFDGDDSDHQMKIGRVLPILALKDRTKEGNFNFYTNPESGRKIYFDMPNTGKALFARVVYESGDSMAIVSITDIFPYLQEAVRRLQQMNLLK